MSRIGSGTSLALLAVLFMTLPAGGSVWSPPVFSTMPLQRTAEGSAAGVTPPNGWHWVYFANHTHTDYSDGNDTVKNRIKEAARFGADIVSITDHKTMAQCSDSNFTTQDGCVPMRGVEWGNSGHACILNMTGTDPLYKKADGVTPYSITETIPLAQARGGSIFINHPFYSTVWAYSYVHAGITGIEVWTTNFPSVSEGEAARNWWAGMITQGSMLVAIGGSDNHLHNLLCTSVSNSNTPCNRVLAASNQPGDVMAGVNGGRMTISGVKGGPHAYLWCDQDGDGTYETPMGANVLAATSKQLRFCVEVREGRYDTLTIYSRNGSVARTVGSGDPWSVFFVADVTAGTKDFIRVDITDLAGAIACVSNPIYINYTPGDADSDGASDLLEQTYGLPFYDSDADDDGVRDGFETAYDGNANTYAPYPSGGDMNATSQDTDSDGVLDGEELIRGTNPLRPNRLLTFAVECHPDVSAGNSISPGTGVHEYSVDDVIPLSASSAAGWRFSQWMVSPSGALPPVHPDSAATTITVDVAKTVTAVFVQLVTLTATVSPDGTGTVFGAGTYDFGASASVTATANAGYRFSHWTGAAAGSANPASITMAGSTAVTAVFVENVLPTATVGALPSVDETSEPAAYDWAVTYADNVAVKASTLDGNDIRVSGPNGFSQLASLVSIEPASGDGTPLTATYRVLSPGGTWDAAEQGLYAISVETAQVTDTVGNAVSTSEIGSFLVNFSPTATLATSAPEPTRDPMAVEVTLSEPCPELDGADIQTTNGSVSEFAGDGTAYHFTLTPSGQGPFGAEIPGGRFVDSTGKPNRESNVVSRTYDGIGPTVTLYSTDSDRVNTAITVVATLDEASADFGPEDVSVTNARVSGFSGSGTDYHFTMAGIAPGAFSCQVAAGQCADALGNPNGPSNVVSRVYDVTGPQITLASSAGAYVNAPIPVAVTLDEPSVDFSSEDIQAANAMVTGFSGAGTAYSFTLTPSGEGPFSCTVPAGRCTDALGNGNSDANTVSRTYDITRPKAQITRVSPSPTSSDTVLYTVTFDEIVAPTFASNDVLLTGSLTGMIVVSGGPEYALSVMLSAPDADGTLMFSLGTAVTDRAGNSYAGGLSPVCDVCHWRMPYFVEQPVGGDRYTGDSHLLGAVPRCAANTMAYQWKWDNGFKTVRDGPTTPSWSRTGLTEGDQGRYWCEVTYEGVTHITDTATLNVSPHIAITDHPIGGEEWIGAHRTFTVTATGEYGPLSYAWKKDGATILSAPNARELALGPLQISDTGRYSVVVRDANTDVQESREALLVVNSYSLPAVGATGLASAVLLVTVARLYLRRRRGTWR